VNAHDRWAEQAQYDLETARAMHKSGRWYLYVLFCCQQSVEKMLKAVIARKTNQSPLRIHQLVRLAETAGLALSEEHKVFFRDLSAYYIQTRYPEEMAALAAEITEPQVRRVLRQTEEEVEWLRSTQ
jgi:HEPN domain-containing protein